MSKRWQKKAADDTRQARLPGFFTSSFKRTATTFSDKENAATPQSSGEVRDDSDRITVKRNIRRSQSRSRTNTPDIQDVSKKRSGTSQAASFSTRAATPDDATKTVRIKNKEVSLSPGKSSTLKAIEEHTIEGAKEGKDAPKEGTTQTVTRALSHTVEDVVAITVSHPRPSSPASFVTASDGLSSNNSSPKPDIAPTTADSILYLPNLEDLEPNEVLEQEQATMGASVSSNQSLKRTHSIEVSGCPRIHEQKPNKRARSESIASKSPRGTQSAPLSIGSSPPIITDPEDVMPVLRKASQHPIQTAPSSSFLLPPPYQSSSISLLSKTPTPPISVSLKRFESLKASFPPTIVIPSSESDENAEPLEAETREMDVDDEQSDDDDDDELTVGVNSSTPIAATLERESCPLSGLHSDASDYDSDASLGNLSDLIPGLAAGKKLTKHGPLGLDGTVSSASDDDMEDLLGTSEKHVKDSAIVATSPAENRRVTRSADGSAKSKTYFKRSTGKIATPTPQYRFSLKDLVKHNKREQNARAEIARAQQVLNQEHETKDDASGRAGTYTKDQDELLATVVNQEEGVDNVGKLLMAMERANAAKTRTTFHFNVEDIMTGLQKPSFPRVHDDKAWSLLEDEHLREEAFSIGFARQILKTCTIDDQKREWLLKMAIYEPEARLADSYLEVLMDAETQHVTPSVAGAHWITSVFSASTTDSNTETIRAIEHLLDSPSREPSPQLLRIIRVMDRIIALSPLQIKVHFLMILAEISIDYELMQNVELRQAHHRAFTSILNSIDRNVDVLSEEISDHSQNPAADIVENGDDVHRSLALSFYNKVDNIILQEHLVSALPCLTPHAHDLRRRLALAYFLNSNLPCRQETDALNSDWALQSLPTMIVTELENDPTLQLTETTDFPILTARIQLLDAAIDCGFSPVFPLPQAAPAPATTTSSTIDPTSLFPNKSSATTNNVSADLKDARLSHNASLDLLLRPLRRLSARIVDTSAMGNMDKTDAKDAVERLVKRLEYAVRVGGRKGGRMGGIWDEEVTVKRKRESLDAWIGAVKEDAGENTTEVGRKKEVTFAVPDEVHETEEQEKEQLTSLMIEDGKSEEQIQMEAKADDSFLQEVTSEITGTT